MKILVLGCKDYPAFKHAKDVGGIETFCNDVLPRLNDIEFSLFTRHYKGSNKSDVIGNIKVTRVSFLNIPLLKTFTFNLLAFFRALKAKSDVVWAHEPVAGFFAYLINKINHIPYILHIHSRGHLEPGNFIRKYGLKLMEHFAYKNAKQVIFVSSSLSKEIRKKGIVIPIGVDVKKFKSASMDGELSSINGRKICYLGRLSSVKGINYLIEAFSMIKKDDLHLIIVGDGDDKPRLLQFVKKLNIESNVHFLGYKNSPSILPFIDVFVLPSLSEGLPHSVLEAIACKKPVVATSVGEIPNILSHYLVKPKDVTGLANAIHLALTNKKLEKLSKEYMLDNVIKSLRSLF